VPPVGAYAGVAALAAAVTYALGFPLRRFATRIGFVVEPDERRVHSRTTPMGGGAAMFAGFLAAMGVAAALPPLQGVFAGSSEPLGLVLGAAVAFGVGLLDDFRDMTAPGKMAGQVLAAMVLVFTGVTMFQFKIPFVGFLVLSPQVTPLLTAVWVIVITNAVNLIDGLDGLAAGVVAIGAGALAIYGLRLVDLGVLPADNIGPLICVVTFGVCLGFLPHNVHVAKVFMGDAGALFLGLLMAAATMVIGGRTPEYSGQSYFFFAPLFIPLFILGVPIADMAFAFVRRTARGTSFHTPDKDHLHHRLLRLGHGPRRTVLILWAWTAVLSGLVLYPLFGRAGNAVVPFVVLALALALYTLFHPGLRQGPADADDGTPAPAASAPAPAASAPTPAASAPAPAAPAPTVEHHPDDARLVGQAADAGSPVTVVSSPGDPGEGPSRGRPRPAARRAPAFTPLRRPPQRRLVAHYRDGDGAPGPGDERG
jgi:UDP-GlcNAc:undecaprenyl-phosphate GlcNAc-1-phosphate transferase